MDDKNKRNNGAMLKQMSLDVRIEMAKNDLNAADIAWVIGALEQQLLNDIPIKSLY